MVVEQIHSVLLRLWTISWNKRDCGEIIIVDPTEHCLALLMLKESGTFKEPKELTSLISKFEYCICLTFLCEINDRVSQKKEDREEACIELQHWFTENNYSTFASLHPLQHMASAIAYDSPGLPRFLWADTENWRSLYHEGNLITFDEICQIFQDTEKKLIKTWEKKVLGGLSLSIPCKAIVDNLTNKDVGYSFLFDVKNTAFKDCTHLIHEVVRGKGSFGKFVVVREGSLSWNVGALHGWLKDYAELHRLLLLRAAILSGALARGSEMTAMTYHNTQIHTTCNLMCMGGHIALVCQYSKTTMVIRPLHKMKHLHKVKWFSQEDTLFADPTFRRVGHPMATLADLLFRKVSHHPAISANPLVGPTGHLHIKSGQPTSASPTFLKLRMCLMSVWGGHKLF
ncbi:hypothetical protein EDD17DRAFT_1510504 [Pisolithus thermaeus]|nr:hypothetical protein EDD17DRAFT_1510504 [Pisolithus thermaeus]